MASPPTLLGDSHLLRMGVTACHQQLQTNDRKQRDIKIAVSGGEFNPHR
ncbi:hypothetical protein LJC45_01120 [Alistipes sp. OttesenSCG-928-B03]|nr:hypothetical protein [Alistipes sp. OttesenSCG-928-B03]